MVRQVHRCDGPIHQGPGLPGRHLAGDSQRHQPVHREPGRVMGDCSSTAQRHAAADSGCRPAPANRIVPWAGVKAPEQQASTVNLLGTHEPHKKTVANNPFKICCVVFCFFWVVLVLGYYKL